MSPIGLSLLSAPPQMQMSAAPSEIELEFAAVTVPSFAKAGRSVGILSTLAVNGCSSRSTTVSPLRDVTVTGTLTKGKPEVTDVVPLEIDEQELLRWAASAELGSEHPLGRAVVERARAEGLNLSKPAEFQAQRGRGVQKNSRPASPVRK